MDSPERIKPRANEAAEAPLELAQVLPLDAAGQDRLSFLPPFSPD
jgi:hypothetical protein